MIFEVGKHYEHSTGKKMHILGEVKSDMYYSPCLVAEDLEGNFGNQKEAFSMAIKALEKQIPKKPNKTIESSWGIQKEAHTCPVCDYYLTEVHFIEPQKIESNKKITYCETCGQAIDWSDEE